MCNLIFIATLSTIAKIWLNVHMHACTHTHTHTHRLPRWLSSKESTCQPRRQGSDPWVRTIPWRRAWQPIPVFLSGKFQGQKSLAGYSPQSHKRIGHNSVTKQQYIQTQWNIWNITQPEKICHLGQQERAGSW